ncbi:fibroblast growth factor 19 [Denticeps clupeoides]|uniref:fibroblast growth factor 19 n=1 Tax=Denticeps clupeoides TaxID=299321 RepID=UPI0010A31B5C|nr:fibroblast growth factor 19 [Denticeps clupeoides]
MLLLFFGENICGSSLGVAGFPLPASGPHVAGDWGHPVRLRHLYAARHGLHLQISKDGRVEGSFQQTSHSLVEISPIDRGCVAIKGVASSRFLCMDRGGSLYGSYSYVKDDCSFEERILPDGYSMYISGKHGAPVSLSRGSRTWTQGSAKGPSTYAQFLPMVSTLSLGENHKQPGHLGPQASVEQGFKPLDLQIDSMDPFGKLFQIYIQSPSFNKR